MSYFLCDTVILVSEKCLLGRAVPFPMPRDETGSMGGKPEYTYIYYALYASLDSHDINSVDSHDINSVDLLLAF